MQESPTLLQSLRIPRPISTIHQRLTSTQDHTTPIRTRPTYPLIIAASGISTSDDELMTLFQQLEIDNSTEPALTPQSLEIRTPIPASPYTAIMNDGILSQTFNDENPKKIEVRMYIQSVETRAAVLSTGSDKELGICQLIFYNGLKGAAMQWFQGLSSEVQDD